MIISEFLLENRLLVFIIWNIVFSEQVLKVFNIFLHKFMLDYTKYKQRIFTPEEEFE